MFWIVMGILVAVPVVTAWAETRDDDRMAVDRLADRDRKKVGTRRATGRMRYTQITKMPLAVRQHQPGAKEKVQSKHTTKRRGCQWMISICSM